MPLLLGSITGGREIPKAGAYTPPLSAQLEDLLDTKLTLEFNLSTIGTYPRVTLRSLGDKVSIS